MSNRVTQREPVSRPGEATEASPGSARKIRVLMERAARRESLFHPGDNLKRRLPHTPTPPADIDPLEGADEEVLIDLDRAG